MKNSQKGFIVPLLISIIVILVIGMGVYVYSNKKAPTINSVEQSNASSTVSTSTDQAATLKTFMFTASNFSFQYPSDVLVIDGSHISDGVGISKVETPNVIAAQIYVVRYTYDDIKSLHDQNPTNVSLPILKTTTQNGYKVYTVNDTSTTLQRYYIQTPNDSDHMIFITTTIKNNGIAYEQLLPVIDSLKIINGDKLIFLN